MSILDVSGSEFTSVNQYAALEARDRAKYHGKSLEFGVDYLDRALRGIEIDDFILLGALPGAGKTEMAALIALHNVKKGKRVHMFALEASMWEIHRRMEYKICLGLYVRDGGKIEHWFNYYDWTRNELDELDKYSAKAKKKIQSFKNLFIYYRTKDFDAHKFKKMVSALNGKSDLIIVDHLHYFDFKDDNENRAMTDAVKVMRDLVLINQTPILLIAHLRKQYKQYMPLVPDLDDFHGTSNIGKIATKAILLSKGDDIAGNKNETFIRCAKCRQDGSVTRFIGKLIFNSSTGAYDKGFVIGKLTSGEKKFEPVDVGTNLMPSWVHAK